MKSFFHIDPLQLTHQSILESKFRLLNHPISEFSFANLFLFRSIHHYEVLSNKDDIFIKGLTRDGIPFIMLTAAPSSYREEALNAALGDGAILFPIPDEWLSYFQQTTLEASFKQDDSDYVFNVSKLALFPGRQLSKKRNLVKQLQSKYDVSSAPLSDQTKEATDILDNWRDALSDGGKTSDYESCLEAIQNLKSLNLDGRIVFLDGCPAGFTIGEQKTKDCYALHFCKGSRTIKGLHQYLYQDLAQSLLGSFPWINIEQDLGIPTIRAAKHSYKPERTIRKWRLKIKI